MAGRNEAMLGLARRMYDESGMHGRLVALSKRKQKGKVSVTQDAEKGIYGESLTWETNWRIRKSLFKKKYITIRHKKHTIKITANGNDWDQQLRVKGADELAVGRFGNGSDRRDVKRAIAHAMRHPETVTARSKSEQKDFHQRVINAAEWAEYGLLAAGGFSAVAALWSEVRLNEGGQPWIAPHSPRINAHATIPLHWITDLTHTSLIKNFSHWSLIPLNAIAPHDTYPHMWLSAESGIDAAVALLAVVGIRMGEKIIKREKEQLRRLRITY